MVKGLLSIGISLAILFQVIPESHSALAASCSVAGGQSGQLKYSGQLSSVSATICGDEIWQLLPKPTKPVKPTTPTVPVKKWDKNFTVVPDRPRISREKTNRVDVGEVVSLFSNAVRHTRNRYLLWYPTQVKFTPKTFFWTFGDGQISKRRLPKHSWLKKGTFRVRLLVGYAVKYRIVGRSEWVQLNGLVNAYSDPIKVKVNANPAKTPGTVVLVHWNCNQKASAIGC